MPKRVQSPHKPSPLSFYVGGNDEKAHVKAVLTQVAHRLGLAGRSELIRRMAEVDPQKLIDALRTVLQ